MTGALEFGLGIDQNLRMPKKSSVQVKQHVRTR
jgi:hypothetical protein